MSCENESNKKLLFEIDGIGTVMNERTWLGLVPLRVTKSGKTFRSDILLARAIRSLSAYLSSAAGWPVEPLGFYCGMTWIESTDDKYDNGASTALRGRQNRMTWLVHN